ncbi:hypothetical protein [Rivularia sp. UHCC 0363]|uniref:hypothetical protein n=1 Tax=Rivularia sp. UHCC 0363 TaxID=3110244 RepID=UPI002B21982D|nr:hypothetical protein [Rivularia sp. UHCC 0363]MEA5594655.1 hypothetical protein [Rivularia sp. UHCC 0363]
MSSQSDSFRNAAIHALDGLLNSQDANCKIQITPEPELGENIFVLTFGEPDLDKGDADKIYLGMILELIPEGGSYECKIHQCQILNGLDSKTLISRLSSELFVRKAGIRKPPEDPFE